MSLPPLTGLMLLRIHVPGLAARATLYRPSGPKNWYRIARILNPRNPRRLLRLFDDAKVGLGRLPAFWIFRLCFLVGDGATDNHIAAILPVRRSRHLVRGG